MIKGDIALSSGGYTAEIASELGGCCLSLKNDRLGVRIFNTPPTEEVFSTNPFLFGNPILFPPNRTRGGEFSFGGRVYRFPINDLYSGSHLHGTLHKTPFSIVNISSDSVTLGFSTEAGGYLDFPHGFGILREYRLGENGLTEITTVKNLSDTPMPFMLAYHTTFDLSDIGESARLSVPVVREQLRDEYYMPINEWASGRERDLAIAGGEYKISPDKLSALYKISGKISRITDPVSRKSLIMECSEQFGYRMIFRSEGANFICIEPQTSAIDLFHLDTPPEENGLIVLAPNESVSLTVRYAAEILK